MGIYTDSGSAPAALLEYVTFVAGVSDDESQASADNDLLAGSTTYWVASIGSGVSVPRVKYDNNGGGLSGYKKDSAIYANELTGPANATGSDVAVFSIWIDYAAAAGGHPAMKRMGGVPFVGLNSGSGRSVW